MIRAKTRSQVKGWIRGACGGGSVRRHVLPRCRTGRDIGVESIGRGTVIVIVAVAVVRRVHPEWSDGAPAPDTIPVSRPPVAAAEETGPRTASVSAMPAPAHVDTTAVAAAHVA